MSAWYRLPSCSCHQHLCNKPVMCHLQWMPHGSYSGFALRQRERASAFRSASDSVIDPHDRQTGGERGQQLPKLNTNVVMAKNMFISNLQFTAYTNIHFYSGRFGSVSLDSAVISFPPPLLALLQFDLWCRLWASLWTSHCKLRVLFSARRTLHTHKHTSVYSCLGS